MGLDKKQLIDYVIRPALLSLIPLIPYSTAGDQLVLGTAITESGLAYLDQVDKAAKPGPAYGLWQMEKISFEDHLLRCSPALRDRLGELGKLEISHLHGNLFLGAAMCRVLYFHAPEPMPAMGDALIMARFWKKRYNTFIGAGTVEKALPCFQAACTL